MAAILTTPLRLASHYMVEHVDLYTVFGTAVATIFAEGAKLFKCKCGTCHGTRESYGVRQRA